MKGLAMILALALALLLGSEALTMARSAFRWDPVAIENAAMLLSLPMLAAAWHLSIWLEDALRALAQWLSGQ